VIETDGLYRFLIGDPTVSGFVGQRVYKHVLPVGYVLPAIVMLIVASEPIESLDGDNATESRRFQFDCLAQLPDVASTLARGVRSLLVPKSDGSGTTTTTSYDLPDGTHVQAARMHLDNDLNPEEGAGPSGNMFRHVLDIQFVYNNP
jgi:hypothetical protein